MGLYGFNNFVGVFFVVVAFVDVVVDVVVVTFVVVDGFAFLYGELYREGVVLGGGGGGGTSGASRSLDKMHSTPHLSQNACLL